MSYFFANIASWNRVQSTTDRVQIQLRTSLSPHNLKTSEPHNIITSEPQNLKTSEPQNLKISPSMLQVLICTLNAGISDIPNILLPEAEGVGYVVSMQYTEAHYLERIPEALRSRQDVTLSTIAGRGLSANRNNALAHATAEVCVIADDDVRYELADLRRIEAEHRAHPEAGVLLFQARGPEGGLLRDYPELPFDYQRQPRGYSPISFEITFKRERVGSTPFDLRFGLGSGDIVCGEEEVWLNTLYRKAACTIKYLPIPVVQTVDFPQGGANFATRQEMQRAKGAVLYYIYGLTAWLRCIKESWTTARRIKEARFITMLRNTARGIIYIMRTGR